MMINATAAFWTLQSIKAPERLSGRVAYVVDGDSLFINSHKPQIRLWGKFVSWLKLKCQQALEI